MKKLLLLAAAALAVASPRSFAGTSTEITAKESAPLASPFDKGGSEVEILAGLFAGFNGKPSEKRPTIDFATQTVRAGRMLYSPSGTGLLRGNTELLLEAFAGEIYQGPGGWLAGGSAIIRYNFVQPGARLVPFIEGVAGVLGNDIYHDKTQRLIGSGFEFNLAGLVGAHWLLTDSWALTVEGGYRHVSNANTASRNLGLNALGGQVGVSYFFR